MLAALDNLGDRKPEPAKMLDDHGLKLVIRQRIKLPRRANLAALNAMTSENADFCDCLVRRAKLTAFDASLADVIMPFD